MQLYTLTKNAAIVIHDEIYYLFSYGMLSAIYLHGNDFVYGKPKISKATEKHVGLFCEYVDCNNVLRLSPEDFYNKVG